jgi:site-specific recombinase XerD
MTLREAIDMWLSQHIATTRESYSRPIIYMMNLVGGDLKLEDITPANMVRYSRYIMDRDDYAIKTKEKHIKTTKTFFNWCLKMDFLDKSPARVLKTPKVPRRITRDKAMDDSDLETLLAYLASDQSIEGVRNYALVKFIADTGCRASGAASLQFANLFLDELYAVVTEKGKARKVAFTPEGAHALRVWIIRRPLRTASADAAKYVFISLRKKYKKMTSDYIGTILFRLKQYIERDWEYEIRRNNPHSMRHRIGH